MITKILKDEELLKFCRELNIDSNVTSILISINENKAEYYNSIDDCFYKLDIKIAKKYI